MERFTLKIIDKPKSTLRNICRLCGMDNPNKISILRDEDVFCEDDVPLATKISVCCGIEVVKKDKMPQKICTLCSDKINDFFEFREMCSATQVQTRDLLGLPREVLKPKVVPQPPPPPAPVPTQNHTSALDTPSQTILQPPIISESRMRDRRAPAQTRPSKKKKKAPAAPVKAPIVKPEVDSPPPPPPPPPASNLKKKVKKKAKIAMPKKKVKFVKPVAEKRSMEEEPEPEPKPRAKKARVEKVKPVKVKPPAMAKCLVCGDVMEKDIYKVHMHQLHSPRTYQFGCSACAVPFETREDLQDHQNWHKQANIPYRCFKCQGTFERISAYTLHTSKSCPGNIEFSNIVPNIDCTICRRQFVTFNLYNWHDCFIKSNTNCPKCNKFIQRKQNLFKHIFSCSGKGNFAPESQEEDVEMPEIKREKVTEKPPEKKVKPLKIRIFDKKRHSTTTSTTVTKVIKTEPDSTLEIEESQVNVEAPSLTTTIEDIQPPTEKSDKSKKKTLKNPYAAIIRKIKQEPKETPEVPLRMAKVVLQKLPDAVSPPRPTVRVKQEPVDTGYESMISIATKNIKKERIDPTETLAGTATLQEAPPQSEEAPQEATEEAPPPELPRGVRIKQERVEKEVIVKPEPIDHAYDKHLPKPATSLQKVAKKRVFKIPSALIKKIQQERSNREQQDTQDNSNETPSQAEQIPETAQVAQNSIPVITGVRSIEKRDFSEPFSTIRIKSERMSPPRTVVHDENIPEENCVNANGENGTHEEELESSSNLENTAQDKAEAIVNNSEHPPVTAEESAPEDHETPSETINHQNGEVNDVPTNSEESLSGQNDRKE